MCGIAGSWEGGAEGVAAMTAALIHRGPDDAGFHASHRVRLGARRLSIVDVAGGAQPVYNETGEICVVANGEIYNHGELRASLQAMGHRFASRCDTEVIVHLYEEYGDRCVEHLRGMFAFAIADGDRLLLARDRFGIKPLFYAAVPGGLAFASEIKALLRHPGLRPGLDMQAFADSLILRYPVGDQTFLEGIRVLQPGHTMTVTSGPAGPATEITRYYRLPVERDDSITFDTARDQLAELLRDTVRSHLVADVEVGLILSGGLDSAALAVAAADSGARLRSFSVGSGPGHPDLIQATRLTDSLGWPHEVTVMTFDDYVDAIPGYTYTQEQPAMPGGVGTYLLYQRAGTRLKVCLNGEGADEVFGGYPEYLDQGKLIGGTEARLRRFSEMGSVGLMPSPAALQIIKEMAVPARSPEAYLEWLFSHNLGDQLTRQHLEVVDKCAMAAGVEMRVPYMDHKLVEFAVTLPSRYKVNTGFGITKHVLKRAVLSAWGADGPIADSVLRRKIGVPSTASRHWTKFDAMCEQELPADYLARHELGRCFARKSELLMHELFCEIYVTGRGADPEGLSMRDFIAERSGRALTRWA